MTAFFGILTKIGEAKEARAKALGLPVVITEMEVGDGGSDSPPAPDREQTAVVGSKRRAPVNRSFVDPSNESWLVVEQVIPEQVGGWWIRQLGLRDADGDLVAVANCPPTYKPLLAEGSARTQVVRMVLQVSSVTSFELKIDPSVVLATRQYVDDGLLQKLDKTGTAVAAAKLATARTIGLTGDGTASVSFDGTKNVSGALTLASSGVTAGSYGSGSTIATFTVDAKGRLIAASSVAVGNAATATKLATARSFSITGGATAAAANFDGSGNVVLAVTALDVSKATLGILPVARGGTGLATVAKGSFLTGDGTNAYTPRTPAQVLEDIQALPKAGGDVTGPILLGAGAAMGSQYGVNTAQGQTSHIVLPDGGGFSSNLATVTGAMKITLPPAAVGNNTMIRLRVEVFEYLTDVPPVTILIHGYAQTSKTWVRHGATIISGSAGSDLAVRFGSDSSGALCIWLGELNKAWSYPTVTVSEVIAKYNTGGVTVAGWATGWKVEPVTAFETVAQTAAVSNLAFARSDIPRVSGLQAELDSRVPVVSLNNLPKTNIGPVLVAETAEVWVWVATSFYTGYRSPLCGRPMDGHTVAPLASEVDAVGGVLQKTAYAALWGYAQENGLVLTQANWEARRGGHYFVNVDANTFRVPDLRDMFRRFTGTDADTANARPLGSRQGAEFLSHRHSFALTPGGWTGGGGGSNGFMVMGAGTGGVVDPSGGSETRPVNAAYHPRVHA